MYDDVIIHFGTKYHSGRYPYGSGETPYQHDPFLDQVSELRKSGLSDTEIAKSLNMSTTEFRQRVSISRTQQRSIDVALARKLKDSGMSNVAIAEQMNKNESTIRSLLDESRAERGLVQSNVSNILKEKVDSGVYVDVGLGSESFLGVSQTKLGNAVKALEEQGYVVKKIQVNQLGTAPGNKTTIKVLCPPDTETYDIYKNTDKIMLPGGQYTEDGGRTYNKIERPKSVDSKRISVRYSEDGGDKKDGIIELRRGVDDISLGKANYAQVRIMVDGTHYLKGMAVYSDDLPDGVDIRFNTSKSKELGKKGVMKAVKDDPDNPFGASIKTDAQLIRAQRYYTDKNGKKQQSVINIVNEEGNWDDWSRTLSSQMLSKQSPALARQQLDIDRERRVNELENIKNLTNPAVKKHLLESYADTCDSAASHLKAAALPRQRTQVILPISSLKDNEVYAPNFRNGETVVLIRFPHAGKFEIPELVVNNNNKEGKKTITPGATDAIGINHKVAARLSGADFDGDSVLVIPNNSGAVKTAKALKGLENFDPHADYKAYEGMPKVTDKNFNKGQQMGSVSNLITDMTIKGASPDEVCRAVKHSMVIIDAEKHNLDWRRSAVENDIAGLKAKYQGGANRGASTLISRASAVARPYARKEIYKVTQEQVDSGKFTQDQLDAYNRGEKVYKYTGESYTKISPSGKKTVIKRTAISDKMAEVSNAYELVSGGSKQATTRIERVYADYANSIKALANEARKESRTISYPRVDLEAKKKYAKEVASLKDKLAKAVANKPLERQAQIVGNARYRVILKDNPGMDAADKSKKRAQCLEQARIMVGAKQKKIEITDKEWEAIQAHAVSYNQLSNILLKADSDRVKQLATPRQTKMLTTEDLSKARQRLKSGYSNEEVAEILGVSVSTLLNALK